MIKRCSLLIVAVLGGLGAYFLRLQQRSLGFVPDTNIPLDNAPTATYLFILTLVIVLLSVLLALTINKKEKKNLAIAVPPFPLLLIGCFAAAATAISAFYQGIVVVDGYTAVGEFGATPVRPNFLTVLFFVLTALGALSLFQLAFGKFTGKDKSPTSALLFPGFAICIWLMISYQTWAQNPYLQEYVYSLFAIITTMLAYYYYASNYFLSPAPGKTQFFATLAIYFSMIALADAPESISAYLYIAQLFYFIPVTVLPPQVTISEEAVEAIKEEQNHD